MTPPRLNLVSNDEHRIVSAGSIASQRSPVSPTLQAYCERVRFARRPSWTPELCPMEKRVATKPCLQARPSGLASSSPRSPGSPPSTSNLSPQSVVVGRLLKDPDVDHSPSYPFPRMSRKCRPQPLSAFSSDTILRPGSSFTSSTTDSESADDESFSTAFLEFRAIDPTRADPDSSVALTSSPEPLLPTTSPSNLYLRASDGELPFPTTIVSPFPLDEPASPLSPFGNLALFDALSPLPTPRFDTRDMEAIDVSALVLEKFETDEGFPWFAVEDGPPQWFNHSHSQLCADGTRNAAGLLDTPPTSPDSSFPARPPPGQLRFGSFARGSPFHDLLSVRRTPGLSASHDTQKDVAAPLAGLCAGPPASSLSSTSPASPASTSKHRLRRSTVNLASIFLPRAKPLLSRGRSASLPATPVHATALRSTSRDRYKRLKRSLSLSRRRRRKSPSSGATPGSMSHIHKSNISAPVPVPPRIPTFPSRRAFEFPRTPPMSRYAFPPRAPPSMSSSTSATAPSHLDPLFSPSSTTSATTLDTSQLRLTLHAQLEKERERSRALEAQVARLEKVVVSLLSDSSNSA